jgi:hypothetical protein
MVEFEVIFAVIFSIFITAGVVLIIDPVERYRKRKYSKWYEWYNEAKTKSFENAEFFKATTVALEYQSQVLLTMVDTGALMQEQANKLIDYNFEAFSIFHKEYIRRCSEVDELLHKAHDYAVENNIKWGLLYDNN